MGIRANQPGLRARIKTGSYTGDGNDNRNIDIGVNLTSKDYVFVQVKNITDTQYTIFKTDYWDGVDASVIHTADAGIETNMIQDLTTTGFEIGTGARVNTNAKTYLYIVVWSEP